MIKNITICSLLMWFLVSTSPAWAAFTHYTPFVVAASQVTGTLSDFPAVISVSDTRFRQVANGGKSQNSSGFDIRPHANNTCTSALTYELVLYTESTGTLEMWVKVPSMATSSTVYLCYGDAALTSDGSDTATWSSSYIGVYHLKDGSSLTLTDSSGNGNTLTNNGTATAVAGKIDGGVDLDRASSQYLSRAALFTIGTAVTITLWQNADAFTAGYGAYQFLDGATSYARVYIKSDGKLAMYTDIGGQSASYDGTGSTTLSTATWYQVAMTFSTANGVIGYVNGAQDGTGSPSGASSVAESVSFYVGRDPNDSSRYADAKVDEIHIASVERSADWIAASYKNQSAPTTFWPLGTEAALGGAPRKRLWVIE